MLRFLLITVLCALPAMGQTLTVAPTNTLSTFALTSNPTTAQTLNVRTAWSGALSWGLQVCVYMSAPMSGSPGNGTTIPASSVRVDGVSIVTATTNCGVPTATQIWSKFIVLGSGNHTEAITIDLNSYPANLEADTYNGTINLVAVLQ